MRNLILVTLILLISGCNKIDNEVSVRNEVNRKPPTGYTLKIGTGYCVEVYVSDIKYQTICSID